MRIALVQHDIAWEDKPASRERAGATLAHARCADADCIAFPEMFETGFTMRTERSADADGSGTRWLADLARARGAVTLGGVTVQGPDGRARNRALVHSPAGAELARYDKVHPFSYAGEHEVFTGGSAVRIFECGGEGAIVAPIICYDLRFPELFRAGRALGAEVFVVIANWPAPRAAHWRALLIARAIENQAFVAGVNRVGSDPNAAYAGGSMVVGPRGEVIAEADDTAQTLCVTIDVGEARQWRAKFPAWNDARAALLPRVRGDGGFDA